MINLTDKITYYTNKNDARDAFLMDVHIHRQLIKQAYDVYGGPFCKAINADEEEVLQRVIRHDLSKINEDVEAKGLIAYYYRYPEPNLELESPRRRYMYQKSMRKFSTLYCIIQRNLFIFALSNNKQRKQ